MDKTIAFFILFWMTYATGGFLTAAHYDQHVYQPCYDAAKKANTVWHDCGVPPVVGIVWPGYWAWRGALHVTK